MGGIKNKVNIYIQAVVAVLGILIIIAIFRILNHKDQATFGVDTDTYVSSDNSQVKNPKVLLSSDAKGVCLTANGCPDSSSNIYLKFKTKGNTLFNAVKLGIYVTDVSQSGGVVLLTEDNWTKSDLKWQNQPKETSKVIGSFGDTSKGGWVEIDLPIKYFKEQKTYSIKLQNKDKNTLGIVSSKNDRYKAQLRFYNVIDKSSTIKNNLVIAAGDISCDYDSFRIVYNDCQDKVTADIVTQKNPQNVLALGDLQYEHGEYKNFLQYFDKTWGKFKDKIKPAPGNHEYNNSVGQQSRGCSVVKTDDPFSYACGYYDYFNGPNNSDGVAGKRGEGYYAYDFNNWRIYSINSNCKYAKGCNSGSEQETWFRRDLSQHPNQCKLMFLHHPIVASDINNFDAYFEGLPDLTRYIQNKANIDDLRDIYKAFYDYGGDLALVGHSHFYERFAKQNIDHEKDDKGFTEIVVGTGGRYTYAIGENMIRPLSLIRSQKGDKGVLQLNLEKNNFKWEFLPAPGTSLSDSGEAACNL